MASSPTVSEALVSRGPFSSGGWSLEKVVLREPKPEEVLVEIVASGICHTDIHCGDAVATADTPRVYYPRVLGHEGSGYVVKVGSAVTKVSAGDPVFLSYCYCGACHACTTGPQSHCIKASEINFIGEPVFSTDDGNNPNIGGRFFGQSSFAKHTIVSDKSVVNAKDFGLSRDDLKQLAPLGCGFQTGSGTVINVANAGPEDAIAIAGIGGVGLAAVMAAKIRNCKTIIGIDRVPARLELAKSLGATHVIDNSNLSFPEIITTVRDITNGIGASITIDTTGYPPLVSAEVDFTRYTGKIIQVGASDAFLNLHMQSFMSSGRQYIGAVQGHSRAEEWIPQMVKWWKEGVFPVERLSQFFDAKDFEEAVGEMLKGGVVKPILVW